LARGSKSAEREAAQAAEGIIAKAAKDALREADDDVAEAVERDVARSAGRDAAERAARPDGFVSPSQLERTHGIGGNESSRTVMEIRDSMRQGGWQGAPVSVYEHGGRRYIVDGHHRIAAARRAGLEQVPYQVVDLPFRGYRTLDDVLELPSPDNLRHKGKRF
jgi:hypothetical protein